MEDFGARELTIEHEEDQTKKRKVTAKFEGTVTKDAEKELGREKY